MMQNMQFASDIYFLSALGNCVNSGPRSGEKERERESLTSAWDALQMSKREVRKTSIVKEVLTSVL